MCRSGLVCLEDREGCGHDVLKKMAKKVAIAVLDLNGRLVGWAESTTGVVIEDGEFEGLLNVGFAALEVVFLYPVIRWVDVTSSWWGLVVTVG